MEEQQKERLEWAEKEIDAHEVRTRRMELEAMMSAKFRNFDRLALNNQ